MTPSLSKSLTRSGDDAKTIYKERAATAECANAQARNRGLTQFLVRSMDKVKTIALWHALTTEISFRARSLPTAPSNRRSAPSAAGGISTRPFGELRDRRIAGKAVFRID
jgi:hypothetical protein